MTKKTKTSMVPKTIYGRSEEMKNKLFKMAALLLLSSMAASLSAQEAVKETPSDVLYTSPCTKHCLKENDIKYSGYINGGYIGNTHGADSNGNVFSNSLNGGALNGAYLAITKEAATSDNGFDWGFGTDIMFGEDTRFIRTERGLDEDWNTGHDKYGNPTYGFAMPQIYAEIALNQWTIKGGHFYTLIGEESTKASDRFFYTTGLSFDSLPVTHTGFLASYHGFEKLDFTLGWVNGINQGFDNSLGGSLILGNIEYKLNDKSSIRYAFTAGDFSDYNEYNISGLEQRYHQYGSIHSWIFKTQLTDKLDSTSIAEYQIFKDDTETSSLLFGEHLHYTINDHWKWGTRIEWQQIKYSDTNDDKVDFLSLTFGPNWIIDEKQAWKIRPEIRYDHCSKEFYGNNADKKDQLSLAIDSVWAF